MAYPVQSTFAAALLLTLAFTVNDGAPASVVSPSTETIQLACSGQVHYETSVASGITPPAPIRCSSTSAR